MLMIAQDVVCVGMLLYYRGTILVLTQVELRHIVSVASPAVGKVLNAHCSWCQCIWKQMLRDDRDLIDVQECVFVLLKCNESERTEELEGSLNFGMDRKAC